VDLQGKRIKEEGEQGERENDEESNSTVTADSIEIDDQNLV